MGATDNSRRVGLCSEEVALSAGRAALDGGVSVVLLSTFFL